MENIKKYIEERLWNVIKRNFTAESYKSAILDSIQYLGDLIREKSGLAGDGVNLIGAAFGGENPKIKLNTLRSETEKNIQKGTMFILQGIYSAYRNPRSHSKIEDSDQTAFEIIIFINHLLKIIDKSKGKFSVDRFIDRVFDKRFVKNQKYADLLVKEVPIGKMFETSLEILKRNRDINIENSSLVWKSIYKKLNDTEKKEIIDFVSEEMRYIKDSFEVRNFIVYFNSEWTKIDEDARIRAENILIDLIPNLNNTLDPFILKEFRGYVSKLILISKDLSLKFELAVAIYNLYVTCSNNNQDFYKNNFGDFYKVLPKYETYRSFINFLREELKKEHKLVFEFVKIFFDKKTFENFKDELSDIDNVDDE